jgi:hypothetical protein
MFSGVYLTLTGTQPVWLPFQKQLLRERTWLVASKTEVLVAAHRRVCGRSSPVIFKTFFLGAGAVLSSPLVKGLLPFSVCDAASVGPA